MCKETNYKESCPLRNRQCGDNCDSCPDRKVSDYVKKVGKEEFLIQWMRCTLPHEIETAYREITMLR